MSKNKKSSARTGRSYATMIAEGRDKFDRVHEIVVLKEWFDVTSVKPDGCATCCTITTPCCSKLMTQIPADQEPITEEAWYNRMVSCRENVQSNRQKHQRDAEWGCPKSILSHVFIWIKIFLSIYVPKYWHIKGLFLYQTVFLKIAFQSEQ